jgi:hypothetical protein
MDIDLDMEKQMAKIAKRFGGKEYGSGCGFGYRDSDYGGFPAINKAVESAKEMKALLVKKGRKAIKATINIDDIEV